MSRPVLLFVSLDATGLKATVEWQSIRNHLNRLTEPDAIVCEYAYADTIEGLGALLDIHTPIVLHIAGHGVSRALHLKDSQGNTKNLEGAQLAKMLTVLNIRPSLVYLNACHSASLVDDLLSVCGSVVAYEGAVDDDYARGVASDFYSEISKHTAPCKALEIACAYHDGSLAPGRNAPLIRSNGKSHLALFPLSYRFFQDTALRHLTAQELKTPEWQARLLEVLDENFSGGHHSYDKPYDTNQLQRWIRTYDDAYIVLVTGNNARKADTDERIVATVKILPLKEDIVNLKGFDPFQITADDLVDDDRQAKAVWVGDLVSSGYELTALFLALRFKFRRTASPIYCRTDIDKLRHILFERYGARVLHPSGKDADGATILVIDPTRQGI